MNNVLYTAYSLKNQIVSCTQLMKYMWEGELFVDDNTLTVNINRLRKKLEAIGLQHFTLTKRGMRYMSDENETPFI